MNIAADLMLRADRVIDQYINMSRRPNVGNITGFASSLIEILRRDRNSKNLLNILRYEHPRPQLKFHWEAFRKAVEPEIRALQNRPDILLRFLGYLKRKAAIRSKSGKSDKGFRPRKEFKRRY